MRDGDYIAILPRGPTTCPGFDGFPAQGEPYDPPPRIPVVPAREAFEREWTEGDAHFVLYLPKSFAPDDPMHRINKGALPSIRAQGDDVLVHWIALDWDTGKGPTHLPWSKLPPERFAAFLDQVDAIRASGHPFGARLRDVAVSHSTRRGWRWIWRLLRGTPADEGEPLIRGLVHEAVEAGFAMDLSGSVANWAQPFRLPRVVRDRSKDAGKPDLYRTSDDPFFAIEVLDVEKTIDPSSIVPLGSVGPVSSAVAATVAGEGTFPSLTESEALLWRLNDKGTRVQSDFFTRIKAMLRGRDFWPMVFDFAPFEVPSNPDYHGSHHDALRHWTLSVVPFVRKEGGTHKHLFALFRHLAENIPGRESSGALELWRLVCGAWDRDTAQLEREKKEKEEEAAKLEQIILHGSEKILAGVREWYPKLPADPAAAWAWVKERAVLRQKRGSYYVLADDGWYGSAAVDADGVVPQLRANGMDAFVPVFDGDGKPHDRKHFLANHVRNVKGVIYRPSLKGGFLVDPEKNLPTLACSPYRRRRDLVPTFSPDVDAWMRVFGASMYELFCRHIGCFLAFERGGVAAMSFALAAGAGKKLVMHGLLECMEDPELFATGDSLIHKFNGNLGWVPFLFGNEGLPEARSHHNNAADVLRRILTGDYIQVELKGIDVGVAKTLIRVALFANNWNFIDGLSEGRNLSPQDCDAIGVRLVHYPAGPAHLFLQERNAESVARTGKIWTEGWIEGDGGEPSRYIVAKHFLWLYEQHGRNASVKNRLLIEGDPRQEAVQRMRARGSWTTTVVESIVRLLASPSARLDGSAGIVVNDERLFVTPKAVVDYWRAEMKGNERLTLKRAGESLAGLVVAAERGQDEHPVRTIQGHTQRWREIDTELLARESVGHGLGSPRLESLAKAQAARRAALLVGAGTNGGA